MTDVETRALTLRSRTNALTLEERTAALTLRSRSAALTLEPVPYDIAPAPVTALFYDTFTGVDGTMLTAHTPDVDVVGGGWLTVQIVGTSTLQLSSNKLVGVSASNAFRIGYANVNAADVTISATMTTSTQTSAGPSGLIARYVNDTNYWRCEILVANDNVMRIVERTAGAVTTRTTTALSAPTNTALPIQVVTNGNSITLSSGLTSISYSSTSHNTATRHGVYVQSSSGASPKFDDFEVT